jgi:DNA-binding beta-propeller fold protein YncE
VARTAPSTRPEALVTAETENRLVVVNPKSGKIERRIRVAADPEFVAANQRAAVVVSPSAGSVTVFALPSLSPIRALHGFGSPHIAAIAPGGRYAYVTDDARGQLAVIRLSDGRLLTKVAVGALAHHISFRPDGREAWIGLGESARAIVIVDTSDVTRPRVVGQFDPGFAAHDLRFAPDGSRVWVTSASSPDVGVFDARSHRLLSRVPGGAPPQHVAFGGGQSKHAYVTSGYGSQIEIVNRDTGRVLKTARAPYGSFDLDVAPGLVATSSLLRGTLAVYDSRLHLLRVVPIAPAARDVALSER